MVIARSDRLRWGTLLLLLGAFLVLQHVAQGSYYEGERHSYYVQPDLQDPVLEQEYQDRAKILYVFALLAGGAFALVLLFPRRGAVANEQSGGGSKLSRPRTALIATLVTLLLTALFGVAHYGLGWDTFVAWGPTFATYYFLLPALILHLAYFALLSNVLCLLKKTVGKPAGFAGTFLALTVFLLVFRLLLSWIGVV